MRASKVDGKSSNFSRLTAPDGYNCTFEEYGFGREKYLKLTIVLISLIGLEYYYI